MFCKRQTLAILSAAMIGTFGIGGVSYAADQAMDHSKMPPSTAHPAPNMHQMEQMQQQMFKMHALMHRIEAEKDPAKRQKLQQEHLRLMQEHMQGMMPMMMSMMHAHMKGGMPCGKGNMEGMDNMKGMDMGEGHQPAETAPKK